MDNTSPETSGTSATVWTIGHSTRSFDEFVALLGEHRIGLLVDVRSFPTSRHVPWATKDSLEAALPARGIGYRHLAGLGGYRKALPDSANTGWRNSSFRGYADYMPSPEFQEALNRLIALATSSRTAIMCAEAVPWKCHRSLISDSLTVQEVRVIHILGRGKTQEHRLTQFAQVRGGIITYPGPHKGA